MKWKPWPKWEICLIIELLSSKAFQGHCKALDGMDVSFVEN
jgi:hypothetical protein